jgi:hypothetical protein
MGHMVRLAQRSTSVILKQGKPFNNRVAAKQRSGILSA